MTCYVQILGKQHSKNAPDGRLEAQLPAGAVQVASLQPGLVRLFSTASLHAIGSCQGVEYYGESRCVRRVKALWTMANRQVCRRCAQ